MKKLIVVAAMAISLFGCKKSATDHSEKQDAAPPQKIAVAYTYQPQSALIHVAVAKGFFAEEGLDVQSQLYTYGKAALQSLLEHKSDIATVAETPVMFSVLKGENCSSSPISTQATKTTPSSPKPTAASGPSVI